MAAFPLWSYSRKKFISRSQPCSYWHNILLSSLSTSPHPCQREADILWWVTPCVGAQKSAEEGGHLVLPAVGSQQCEGPSLGNSSAALADAKAELNFMGNTHADIGHFKDAHKQQEMSFTKTALRYLGGEDKLGTALFWKGTWKCGDTLKATLTFPPCCCVGGALQGTQLQEDTFPGQQMEHAQVG